MWPFALFLIGALIVIWATERLLEGLVGVARLVRISTFAVAAILSGLEAENVAVGLVAARGGSSVVALGTVFGGAIFVVCIALGLGALIYPLRVRLPRGFLVLMASCPVLVGLGLLGGKTSRLAGVVLLLAFAAALVYLILASRRRTLLGSEEVREASEKQFTPWKACGLTALGIAAIALGGELVNKGATGMISTVGLPSLLVGMVITPAAIEIEEVIRQAVPAKEGHPEVSAGNLVGTLLYFLWFNLGLISLFAPVQVNLAIIQLDWPYLIGVSWLATLFLVRGRIGRVEGAVLVAAYIAYVVLRAFYS